MTLLSLGDRDAALDLFRTAYELRAPEARRSRFNDLAHLLAAQVSVVPGWTRLTRSTG
jgi:hypothetical protein